MHLVPFARIVNGSRARILLQAHLSSPLEALIAAYQLPGAFPGGPPRLACALADPSLFLVLENLLPYLQLRHELPFSTICGQRLLCQAAGPVQRSLFFHILP